MQKSETILVATPKEPSWLEKGLITLAVVAPPGWFGMNALLQKNLKNAGVYGALSLVALLVSAAIVRLSRRPNRKRLTIDIEKRSIVFEYFRVSDGFWPKPARPRFECRFEDILALHHQPNLPYLRYLLVYRYFSYEMLVVVTRQGKINVDDSLTRFQEIREILECAVTTPSNWLSIDNPMALGLIAFVIGLILTFCVAAVMKWI